VDHQFFTKVMLHSSWQARQQIAVANHEFKQREASKDISSLGFAAASMMCWLWALLVSDHGVGSAGGWHSSILQV